MSRFMAVSTARQATARQALSALAFVMLLLVAACGGSSAPADVAGVSSPEAAAEGQRLWIKQGDETLAFANGDEVASNGITAEIFVSPYPPGRSANIDFYLTRGGQPVEDANVSLQYDMTVMEHGPFQLLAVPTGRGHYLAAVDFAMDGVFWLNVSADAAGDESVINMLVKAAR